MRQLQHHGKVGTRNHILIKLTSMKLDAYPALLKFTPPFVTIKFFNAGWVVFVDVRLEHLNKSMLIIDKNYQKVMQIEEPLSLNIFGVSLDNDQLICQHHMAVLVADFW